MDVYNAPTAFESSSSALQASFPPPPHSTSAYSLPYPTPNSHYSQPIPALQPLPPPVPLPSLPNQPNTDLNDFFASLDAELGYWQTIGQETHDSGASAEFTTMPMPNDPDAELPMKNPPSFLSPPPPLAEPLDSMNPDQARRSGESQTTDHSRAIEIDRPGPLGAEAIASTSAQTLDDPPVQSSTSTSNSSPDEPDVVDPVYNSFNEGFFRSLPKPVRDIVVKRIYGLANSHELSRNASMAMVMLYRLRMQSSSEENPDVAASTDAQARLLAQSDVYFQRAMEHLQKPIPFEAKLVATLDMQAYQVRDDRCTVPRATRSHSPLALSSSINLAQPLPMRFCSSWSTSSTRVSGPSQSPPLCDEPTHARLTSLRTQTRS